MTRVTPFARHSDVPALGWNCLPTPCKNGLSWSGSSPLGTAPDRSHGDVSFGCHRSPSKLALQRAGIAAGRGVSLVAGDRARRRYRRRAQAAACRDSEGVDRAQKTRAEAAPAILAAGPKESAARRAAAQIASRRHRARKRACRTRRGQCSRSGWAPAAKAPARKEVAQTSAPAAEPAPENAAPANPPPPAGGESAPIAGPSAEQQQARQVVETAPSLSTVGGVLTPKGQIVIDPSFEYDYWSQNQLGVNGFQIIPGITFGNIFVTRFEQNISTAAVTVRGGVTDRLELNAKIPLRLQRRQHQQPDPARNQRRAALGQRHRRQSRRHAIWRQLSAQFRRERLADFCRQFLVQNRDGRQPL